MTGTRPNPIQTTDAGIPVESDEYSLTVGAGGPIPGTMLLGWNAACSISVW